MRYRDTTSDSIIDVSDQFLWCLEGELIESDDLTTGGQDAGTGSLSNAEGADLELSKGLESFERV